MAKFNTFFPYNTTSYGLTSRTIQTASGTGGFYYIFMCPADFASGATFRTVISVASNGNNTSTNLNVGARLYALNGSGIADTATPLSSATLTLARSNVIIAGETLELALTLTSALTKGVRYALRIYADATLTASIGFNAITTGTGYNGQWDEYHVNGSTIGAPYPNFSIGNASVWLGNKCVRDAIRTTTATSTVTSQVGFRFALPTGLNYTLNEILVKGLILSSAGATTGSYTGRLLASDGTTTIASTPSVLHANITSPTSTAAGFTFPFTTNPTLTGGTVYIFVVESALGKQLQYYHIQSTTDTTQSFNGEVTNLEVVSRNATSGAFSTFATTAVEPAISYSALPFAHIDAIPVGGATGSGMVVHPGMKGGING